MDTFRLRAFYVLHKEKIDVVLEPWVNEGSNLGYNYSRHNLEVYSRAHNHGLFIPESLRSSFAEAAWASYWRLFLHLREAKLIGGIDE